MYLRKGDQKSFPVFSSTNVCLSAEIPVPSAALQTRWSAVFTSETVEMKCRMQDSPDHWDYTWYRGQEGVVQGAGGSDKSQLVISSAGLEHAGQYTCTGQLRGRPVKSGPSKALSLEVKGELLLMLIMNTESNRQIRLHSINYCIPYTNILHTVNPLI